jgi:hypothetical protein
MRWLDALLEYTDDSAIGIATFDPDHFAVADGTPLESALVECVAQTVAAALGCRAMALGHAPEGGVPSASTSGGMLAAISGFRIVRRPPLGKPLRIETKELKRFGPMLLVLGTISCDGELIASGELTLYA